MVWHPYAYRDTGSPNRLPAKAKCRAVSWSARKDDLPGSNEAGGLVRPNDVTGDWADRLTLVAIDLACRAAVAATVGHRPDDRLGGIAADVWRCLKAGGSQGIRGTRAALRSGLKSAAESSALTLTPLNWRGSVTGCLP